jgi:hypothetical protein
MTGYVGGQAYIGGNTMAPGWRETELRIVLLGPKDVPVGAWCENVAIATALLPYGRVIGLRLMPNSTVCVVTMAAREDIAAALREGTCEINQVTLRLLPGDHPVAAGLVGLQVVHS